MFHESKESAFLEDGFGVPLKGLFQEPTSSAMIIEPRIPSLVYFDGALIV